jgi:hypothetical protein
MGDIGDVAHRSYHENILKIFGDAGRHADGEPSRLCRIARFANHPGAANREPYHKRTERSRARDPRERYRSARRACALILAQEINERLQRRRHLTAARIVKRERRAAWLPVLEQRNNSAFGDCRRHIGARQLHDADAVEDRWRHQRGFIQNKRAADLPLRFSSRWS